MITEGAKIGLSKIESRINRLAEMVDEAAISAEMKLWLEMQAKFHSYSLNNVINIIMQMPSATMVGGWRNCWEQKFNRTVKFDQRRKYIWILAPMFRKDKETGEEKLVSYKSVKVFDVSQTEGDPIPDQPRWWTEEKLPELESALLKVAEGLNVQVIVESDFTEKNDGALGVSKGGTVIVDAGTGTRTLIHEIAHEIQKQDGERGKIGRSVAEAQVDAIAFVVAEHFGAVDMIEPNYIALHGNDGETIRENMDWISKTARKLIVDIENILGNVAEAEAEAEAVAE